MGRTRNFLKNRSKLVKVVLSTVILLSLVGIGLRIHSVVSEDLSIFLTPGEAFVTLAHGEQENLSFSLRSNNYLFCEAACSADLSDLATGEIVREYRNVTLRNSNGTFSFQFKAPPTGEVMRFYSLSVQCRNNRKLSCNREERTVSTEALVVVNYTLTQEEQSARNTFLGDSQPFLEFLKQADLNVKKSELLLNELERHGQSFGGLSEQFYEDNVSLSGLKRDEQVFRILLDKEEYLQLGRVPLDSARELVNDSNETFSMLREYFDLQNELASLAESSAREEEYGVILSVFNNTGEDWLFDTTKNNMEDFNSTITSLTREPSSNVPSLFSRLKWNRKEYDAFKDEALRSALEVSERGVFLINQSLNQTYNLTVGNLTWESYEDVCSNASSLNVSVPGCGNLSHRKLYANVAIQKIYPPSLDVESGVNTSIRVPEPRCCNANGCGSCPSSSETPVLFLHGHSMNERNSPEYSLQAFSPVINHLERDGVVVDAGDVTPYSATVDFPRGGWSNLGTRVAVRGTYYFDTYLRGGSYVLSSAQSESIDTYAVRLKEVVDVLKHRTGSDKVVVVTHSMGGLVARRYAQIFGAESLEKLVLVGTPNHGITDTVQTMCPVFGADRECRNMAQGSIFLAKLNDPSLRVDVNTTVIIGTGCNTNSSPGDGVVRVESALLEGAESVFVEGSCTAFNTLHTELLSPTRYPEAYHSIRESLR